MKMTFPLGLCGILACFPLLFSACTNSVSQNDLSDARQDVEEQKEETRETIADANQKIAEKQADVDEARHEAMKPVATEGDVDAVEDEKRELRDTIREGRNDVEEKLEDTSEAEKEAEKVETKLAMQEERDAYIKTAEAKLEAADKRVEELQKQGENLEGPAKEENELEITQIKDRRNQTSDALETLRDKEVMKWKESKELVDRAMNDLTEEMQESK